MVACVTFETAKVVEPSVYYDINKIHIIHYVKDINSDAGKVYGDFLRRVSELLCQQSKLEIEIETHNQRVSDFSVMLRCILSILRSEKEKDPDSEIFINISSGSPEYAAAAAIASMMVDGTLPFSVGTKEYTVPDYRIPEIYYIDGEPVGLSKSTYEPRALSKYAIEMPEEHLVKALRILDKRNASSLSVTSGKMVEEIKNNNIWFRKAEKENENRKSSQKQTDAVYYQRDFVSKWLKYGWVEKNELGNRYELTEKGKNVVNIFYTESQEHR